MSYSEAKESRVNEAKEVKFIEFRGVLINVDELQNISFTNENTITLFFHKYDIEGKIFDKSSREEYLELCQNLCTYKDFIRLGGITIRISCILFLEEKEDKTVRIRCKNKGTFNSPDVKYEEAVEIITNKGRKKLD